MTVSCKLKEAGGVVIVDLRLSAVIFLRWEEVVEGITGRHEETLEA